MSFVDARESERERERAAYWWLLSKDGTKGPRESEDGSCLLALCGGEMIIMAAIRDDKPPAHNLFFLLLFSSCLASFIFFLSKSLPYLPFKSERLLENFGNLFIPIRISITFCFASSIYHASTRISSNIRGPDGLSCMAIVLD